MAIVLKIKLGDDTRRVSLERPPSYEELVKIVNQLFVSTSGPFQLKYEDEDKDQITVTTQAELSEAFTIASEHFNNVLRIFVSEPKAPTPTPAPTAAASPSLTAAELCFLKDLISSANIAKMSPEVLKSPAIRQVLGHLGLSSSPVVPCPSPSPSPSLSASLPSMPSMGRLRTSNEGWSFPSSNSNNNQEPAAANQSTAIPVHTGVTCDGCGTADIVGNRFKCTICRNYDLCEKCRQKGDEIHPSSHNMKLLATPVVYHQRRGPFANRFSNSNNNASNNTNNTFSAGRSKPVARFVRDVTITDGTRVLVGSKITKTWRVRNDGDVAWPSGAILMHVGGEILTPNTSVSIPLAVPGEEVDVSVDLTMPAAPGRYNTFWRLCTAEGVRFGQRMWADVIVCRLADRGENLNLGLATTSAAPTPASTATPTPTPTPTPAISSPTPTTASPTPTPATATATVVSPIPAAASVVPTPAVASPIPEIASHTPATAASPIPTTTPAFTPIFVPVTTPASTPVPAPAQEQESEEVRIRRERIEKLKALKQKKEEELRQQQELFLQNKREAEEAKAREEEEARAREQEEARIRAEESRARDEARAREEEEEARAREEEAAKIREHEEARMRVEEARAREEEEARMIEQEKARVRAEQEVALAAQEHAARLRMEEEARLRREEEEKREQEEEARIRAHQEELRRAAETLALRNQQESERVKNQIEEQRRQEERTKLEQQKVTMEEDERAAVEACRKKDESDAVKQLLEMGFSGPILTILRKHNGDINATMEELLSA